MKALIASFMLALAMWASSPAYAEAPHAGNQIAGLWDVVAIPFPGQPGPEIILSHASFGRDGTMTVAQPGGGAVGAWEREAGNRYVITFVGYSPVGADTLLLMSVHATVEIVDDKQTFTGLFRTVVTALADPQGMFPPSFSFEGTVEGHRVSVAGF